MQGLWPKHDVDIRRSLADTVAFLARDTSADADHDAFFLLFDLTPAP